MCVACSYFGTVAFNIWRQTLHSVLKLLIRGKRCNEQEIVWSNHKFPWQRKSIWLLIIFCDWFGWIDRRCSQSTDLTSCLFYNLSVILVGDIAQLPPIANTPLYYTKPVGDLALQDFYGHQAFRTVITLKVNQLANGESEENSRKLLINLRIGKFSKDDWKLLFSHNPHFFYFKKYRIFKLN